MYYYQIISNDCEAVIYPLSQEWHLHKVHLSQVELQVTMENIEILLSIAVIL